MAKKRLTKKAKLELIAGSGGLLVDVARLANVNRATVRAWRDKDPDIAAAIEAEREHTSDRAEQVIINAIDAGDVTAAKYWLSTIGRDRGFTTRTELDGQLTHHAQIQIVKIPDNNRGD